MPTPSADRTILHLDADAFFASVEQRDDPHLRGRPVAVGSGVVASCSYEARHFGVRTGMRLADARHLCRPLVVLPGEYPRYEQAARCILAICEEQTPRIEVAALDDLYLDLTRQGGGDRVARELREHIQEEVRLSVSIGIGSSKLVATVATNEAKPGKQIQVLPGRERDYLSPWPARVLPHIGPKIESRLDRLNVHRVGEVADMPVPVLRNLFGRLGRVLHEQAHGIDPRPVEPRKPPQSVSRRTSFDPPVGERAFLQAMLDYLLERAVTWMRFQNLAARGLSVVLRYGDDEGAEGRELLARPTNTIAALREAARDRFARLYQRRLPLRLLGVALSPLVPPDDRPGLFPDLDAERARRLDECTAAVRERFGFTALLRGSALVLAQRLDRDRENFRLRTPCLTR